MLTASEALSADMRERETLAGTLAMWVFLASELLLFGPLFLGYAYVRLRFPDAAGMASRQTDMLLGTVNTAVLLTSSLCMALAVTLCKRGDRRAGARLLWLTAALGVAFLVIKGIEYRHEFAEHLFPDLGFSPAVAATEQARHGMQLFFLLYFAMTALHALHLTFGIGLCALMALRRAGGDAMELGALYWHFVDVVWIFLYPLLYLVNRAGG